MANEGSPRAGTEYEGYLSTVTKEAGFAFTGRVFGLAFGFIAQVIIANLIGADLLGVFVLAWTIVHGVTIVTAFGFENSLVRYVPMYLSQGKRGEARSVVALGNRVGLLAGVLGTIAIVLLRGPLARSAFHEPRLETALLWISLAILPLTFMKLFGASLRGVKDVKRFILGFDIAYRIPRLAAFLVLFLLGFRLRGVVGAAVVGCLVSVAVLARFLRRQAPFLIGANAERPAVDLPTGAVLAYSAAMLADTAMAFSTQHTDKLVLGIFLDSAVVGVYNVAALVASLTVFLLLSFNAIFSPVISDVYHRGRTDLLQSLFRSITRWIIVLTLPIYAWILAAGESTLAIFGDEFVAGYAALVFLATGQMVAASVGPVGICLAMTGYQRYNVGNAIAMAIVGIGLNVMLVPRMGMAGAGLATGAAFVLVNLARLVEVRILLGITPYDRATLKVAATAAIAIGLAYAARRFDLVPAGVVGSAVTLVAAAAIVGLLTFAMGTSDEDRFVLGSVLKKIRRVGGRAGDGGTPD